MRRAMGGRGGGCGLRAVRAGVWVLRAALLRHDGVHAHLVPAHHLHPRPSGHKVALRARPGFMRNHEGLIIRLPPPQAAPRWLSALALHPNATAQTSPPHPPLPPPPRRALQTRTHLFIRDPACHCAAGRWWGRRCASWATTGCRCRRRRWAASSCEAPPPCRHAPRHPNTRPSLAAGATQAEATGAGEGESRAPRMSPAASGDGTSHSA